VKGFRAFMAIVLGLFMVGFGLCAGCGALIVANEPRGRMDGVIGLVVLGAVLAVACFFGMRALWRSSKKDE